MLRCVFFVSRAPPGTQTCDADIRILMYHKLIVTMFGAKSTKVSHMDRTSYCFEEYGVVKACHSRKGDTRPVNLIYFLPSPQSH